MYSEKLSSLIDVKTIVTFIVTAVFAYLAAIGKMEVKDFMLIAVMVFTYFFTKQPTPAPTSITTETTTTEKTIPLIEK